MIVVVNKNGERMIPSTLNEENDTPKTIKSETVISTMKKSELNVLSNRKMLV